MSICQALSSEKRFLSPCENIRDLSPSFPIPDILKKKKTAEKKLARRFNFQRSSLFFSDRTLYMGWWWITYVVIQVKR